MDVLYKGGKTISKSIKFYVPAFLFQVTSGTGDVSDILERAQQRQINLRKFDDKTVKFSLWLTYCCLHNKLNSSVSYHWFLSFCVQGWCFSGWNSQRERLGWFVVGVWLWKFNCEYHYCLFEFHPCWATSVVAAVNWLLFSQSSVLRLWT